MGRGWKRIALDADTAPVPYSTAVFQGAETNRQGEVVPGRQRQCGQNADLDSFDRHADLEVPADEVQLWRVAFQSGRARAPATVHLQGLVGVAQQSAGGTACCKATGRTVTHAADVVVMSLDSRRNPSIHLSLKHSTYTITTWTAGCRTHRNPYRAASRTNLPLSAEKMPVSSEINSADSPKTPSWTRVIGHGEYAKLPHGITLLKTAYMLF